MRKLLTIIVAATSAVTAYANDTANVENYYAPGGYYVGKSPGPGRCGYIYPSKKAAEAAEDRHTAQVNWKVGPPGPNQTEDWGKPTFPPGNAPAPGYTGPGASWPAGSKVVLGKYVMGPSINGRPGQILATGSEATATPSGEGPTSEPGIIGRLVGRFVHLFGK